VIVTATAIDAEDGDVSAGLSWRSSLDGPLGNGASLTLETLSAGSHILTAEASDSSGNRASASIVVHVNGLPAVTIGSPANGSSFRVGTPVDLTLTAVDMEDGDLGQSAVWTSSADGVIGQGARVPAAILSAGRHVVMAQVSDSGGNVGRTTIAISIDADAPPAVAIRAPSSAESFASGATIVLAGTASDGEDGSLEASIAWSSNLDGPLGSGAGLQVSLSDGFHTITAEVGDSSGQRSSSSVWIMSGRDAGPHGGYGVITDGCATCHRTHTAESAPLVASSASGNAFCLGCHDGSGASVPPYVSTHSNIDLPGMEASFEILCIQCHNPHGSSNLAGIREDVFVAYPDTTSGPVVLSATSGADSYDDGEGNTASRVCTVCHDNSQNPGYPMANHIGGANHAGGVDYSGTDCTVCHPHSADTDTGTRDGFMPVGGGCTGCHAVAQDNGDGVPVGGRRQITGTEGDFVRASHHVAGEPEDADCNACHEQSQHMTGFVRLLNADNPELVYVLDGAGDPAELESFCLACHDANGAGGLPPFTDAQMPPVIDAIGWGAASHKSPAGYSCIDCHDNGHGSNKVNLLAPWDAVPDGHTDDPLVEEERFCGSCHDGDGPSSSDISSLFAAPTNWVATAAGENTNAGLNDRHDISLSDQGISGAKIECSRCHDPHLANGTMKVIADPDPADGRMPGSGYFSQGGWATNWLSDWCLDCHDGSYPASITPPVTAIVDIYGSWGVGGSTHGAGSGTVKTLEGGLGYTTEMLLQCLDCHTEHVSAATPVTGMTNLYHLKAVVMTADGSAPVPTDGGGFGYEYSSNNVRTPAVNGYDWCQTCHVDSMGRMKTGCDSGNCHFHGLTGRW
jgi:predicted CXXCH cytochrome family protein